MRRPNEGCARAVPSMWAALEGGLSWRPWGRLWAAAGGPSGRPGGGGANRGDAGVLGHVSARVRTWVRDHGFVCTCVRGFPVVDVCKRGEQVREGTSVACMPCARVYPSVDVCGYACARTIRPAMCMPVRAPSGWLCMCVHACARTIRQAVRGLAVKVEDIVHEVDNVLCPHHMPARVHARLNSKPGLCGMAVQVEDMMHEVASGPSMSRAMWKWTCLQAAQRALKSGACVCVLGGEGGGVRW